MSPIWEEDGLWWHVGIFTDENVGPYDTRGDAQLSYELLLARKELDANKH
jgi:hypothetical protein